MPRSTILRRGAVLAAALALVGVAGAAHASYDRDGDRWRPRDDSSRTLYATTDQNLLVQFDERSPRRLDDVQLISGLPAGVTLRGSTSERRPAISTASDPTASSTA